MNVITIVIRNGSTYSDKLWKRGRSTVSETKKQVVIIGGGITGLATSYYLQKQVREQQLPLEVKL